MTFTGSPTDIQNALGNLTAPSLGLTFNPDANFNGIATLTVTANDGVAAPVHQHDQFDYSGGERRSDCQSR